VVLCQPVAFVCHGPLLSGRVVHISPLLAALRPPLAAVNIASTGPFGPAPHQSLLFAALHAWEGPSANGNAHLMIGSLGQPAWPPHRRHEGGGASVFAAGLRTSLPTALRWQAAAAVSLVARWKKA